MAPEIPLLDIYSIEMKACAHEQICTAMFIAFLLIIPPKLRMPQNPATH